LIIRKQGIKVKSERPTNRLHYLRRLRMLGIDFEKMSPCLQTFGLVKILRLAELSVRYGAPLRWDWFRKPLEEVEARLKNRSFAFRRDQTNLSNHNWIIAAPEFIGFLIEKDKLSRAGKLAADYGISLDAAISVWCKEEAHAIKLLETYIAKQAGKSLAYEQISNGVGLTLLEPIDVLKRALGVLSQRGFYFTIQSRWNYGFGAIHCS
jgi:hypothetical protein